MGSLVQKRTSSVSLHIREPPDSQPLQPLSVWLYILAPPLQLDLFLHHPLSNDKCSLLCDSRSSEGYILAGTRHQWATIMVALGTESTTLSGTSEANVPPIVIKELGFSPRPTSTILINIQRKSHQTRLASWSQKVVISKAQTT